jgi:hypothetical protein
MPPAVIAIISGIEMAIRLLPGVINVVTTAKEFLASLFGAGVITAAQQAALFARIDEITRQAVAGQLPEHWAVEPDPVTGKTMAENTTITVTQPAAK